MAAWVQTRAVSCQLVGWCMPSKWARSSLHAESRPRRGRSCGTYRSRARAVGPAQSASRSWRHTRPGELRESSGLWPSLRGAYEAPKSSLPARSPATMRRHPHVAILGFGRMIEKPWVVGGAVVPRRMTQMSFVLDHRVCDAGGHGRTTSWCRRSTPVCWALTGGREPRGPPSCRGPRG